MSNGTVKNDNRPGLINKGNGGRYGNNVPKEGRLVKRSKVGGYTGKVKGKPFPLARKVGQLGRP